jgi:ABC-type Fe3+-hydroxamate transport system substrate-binding protein
MSGEMTSQRYAKINLVSDAEGETPAFTERVAFTRPIAHVPTRVVSLVPSITESLFDLALGDRLVGVTEFCTRPADKVAALPKVGGTKNPDLAAIIALRPDLVLLNSEENRRADAEALTQAGIPIWVTEPRTVRQAVDLLWQMMDVFEHAEMVYRVRMIEIAYETTLRYMTESALEPVRAFVPIWRDPWMTINQETYVHDLLHTCGLINVFAERVRQYPLAADLGEAEPIASERDTRYPRLSEAEIIAAQPEVILLPDEPYAFSEVDLAEVNQRFAETPAVKNGHVYLIDGAYITWHGTRLAYALNELPPLVTAIANSLAKPDKDAQ